MKYNAADTTHTKRKQKQKKTWHYQVEFGNKNETVAFILNDMMAFFNAE